MPGVGPLDEPGCAAPGPTGAAGTSPVPGAVATGSAGATQPANAASGTLPTRGAAMAETEPANMTVTTIPPTVTYRLITLSCPSCHTVWQGAQ